jgi:hypothetical protein
MGKNKRLVYWLEEEWLRDLYALAGTFGASPEEVIRQSLPDEAVIRLFFQCKDYLRDLRWDEVGQVGRDAIREHLRARYMEGLKQHLARLGLDIEGATTEDVEAARKRALDELSADPTRPLECQFRKAEQDSVYLGYLYEAWKRAEAGEPGYAVAQIEVEMAGGATHGGPTVPQKVWAVLKDGQIV